MTVSCKIQHHGAAASSTSNVVAWIPSSHSRQQQETTTSPTIKSHNAPSTLVYASHGLVNLARQITVNLANGREETVWHVYETLRTDTGGTENGNRVITSIAYLAKNLPVNQKESSGLVPAAIGLVAGFSDGTVTLWLQQNGTTDWKEVPVLEAPASSSSSSARDTATRQDEGERSITALDAQWCSRNRIAIVTGSSSGARLCHVRLEFPSETTTRTLQQVDNSSKDTTAEWKVVISIQPLLEMAMNAVRLLLDTDMGFLVLLGSAAPRHNKIHVFHRDASPPSLEGDDKDDEGKVRFAGSLAGHEDWITALAWNGVRSLSSSSQKSRLLASSSQDARIRLWKFSTSRLGVDEAENAKGRQPSNLEVEPETDDETEDDDEDRLRPDEDEEDEEGESRLEIYHADDKTVTRVTLEALLMGHEESVTSVAWHPQPMPLYGQENILISSSMDRSILLWCPAQDGIWSPLARVGSAGGILGGSVGSSLLGYLAATFEPSEGRCLIGHAYGGALHVWQYSDDHKNVEPVAEETEPVSTEEGTNLVRWKAQPCLTGHFGGVTDLCWETLAGDYLLTVSLDQTCRLWAPVPSSSLGRSVWVELARPQVHGYDMSAVVSLSTCRHAHLFVSGSDEKELRVFDAPRNTVSMLKAISGIECSKEDSVDRVDRAYIPALGLSNKATAADGAEEDIREQGKDQGRVSGDSSLMRLPLELDLGSASLWPEILKLFGHKTELYCLASTLAARTAGNATGETPSDDDLLVASACKARDVDSAAIRLWRVEDGKCHQVLQGGHKSTVATLSFSADARYLVSSGKDRRLCIWERNVSGGLYALACAKDSAHKRIVWSADFCPFAPTYLASGSRDGCVKLWNVGRGDDEGGTLTELYSFSPACQTSSGKADAVTALSFGPKPLSDDTALLALGLETGCIELWRTALAKEMSTEPTAILELSFSSSLCHMATVTKLAWKPIQSNIDEDGKEPLLLASSSMDHGCRIFEIQY